MMILKQHVIVLIVLATTVVAGAPASSAAQELSTKTTPCRDRGQGIPETIQHDQSRVPGDSVDRVEWLDFDGDGRCDVIGYLEPESRMSGAYGFFYRAAPEGFRLAGQYVDMLSVLAFYPQAGSAPYLLTFGRDGRPTRLIVRWDETTKKMQSQAYWTTRENSPEAEAVMAALVRELLVRGKTAIAEDRQVDARRDLAAVYSVLGRHSGQKLRAEVAYFRAVSHYLEGAFVRAVIAVNQSLQYDPDRPQAFYVQGLVYERISQDPGAIREFGKHSGVQGMTDGDVRLRAQSAFERFVELAESGRLKQSAERRIAAISRGTVEQPVPGKELLQQLGITSSP